MRTENGVVLEIRGVDRAEGHEGIVDLRVSFKQAEKEERSYKFTLIAMTYKCCLTFTLFSLSF